MAFEPRSVVSPRSAFGDVSQTLAPVDGVEPTDHRYRGALLQHRLANLVREELRISGTSLPAFLDQIGDLPGLSKDRQRRMLRGESSATYADLAFWAGHFPRIAAQLAAYLASWAEPTVTAVPASKAPPTVLRRARPPMRS
ncbi:hypothetical protein [Microbacterium sp. NPDC058389]|uniref:hypothetical protein n=1 Tax=Microbacterium sp. NPDC058389 TaxID=3346475 RepID=UPI00365712E6